MPVWGVAMIQIRGTVGKDMHGRKNGFMTYYLTQNSKPPKPRPSIVKLLPLNAF